jgi:Domain of unknown function (DUF4129)
MSTAAEKTSWRWQLEQLQQQVGEWVEVKLRSNDRDLQLDSLPPWLEPLLVRLMWLILAGIVIWIGYRIIYPYWQSWLERSNRSKLTPDRSPEKVYTVAELLAQSQQFQQVSDYTQASRWMYLAMLQRLNDANLIPHQLSRTDREYLQLLGTVPVANIGEILVDLHEQLHFGDRAISSADFDRCQQAYQQMESQLIVDS